MAEGTIVGLFGTLGVEDTVAVNTATVQEIGEDKIWANAQLVLAKHNMIVNELMDKFVMRTQLQLMRYGGLTQMDMDELTQHDTPDAQKVTTGSLVGFPLRKYGRSLQWTKTYFQEMTGAEFNAQFTALIDADVLNVIRQLKRAMFKPTNASFIDKLVRPLATYPLPVKALANADGAPIPPGPNGEYFDGSTHTHYLGATSAGTFAEADAVSAVNTVKEHDNSGQIVIFLNSAQENAMRAFTGFTALVDDQIVQGANLTYARGGLDVMNLYNRRIGRFQGADVWIKPWMIASYMLTLHVGVEKVLGWRSAPRKPDTLTLVGEFDDHPLRANSFERNFGLGVFNRVGASLLDIAHTSYTAPTIA